MTTPRAEDASLRDLLMALVDAMRQQAEQTERIADLLASRS
jgi:hypothetical protein